LATLLDANVCQVNCLLDLWQDPDGVTKANGQKEMKEKIEEIIGKGWWHQLIGIFNYIFPYWPHFQLANLALPFVGFNKFLSFSPPMAIQTMVAV
jgi:hypothetical protein